MTTHRPNVEGRFERLALPFYGAVALGNGTQYRISAFRQGSRLVVGIETHGTYTFGAFVHWAYAAEKLQLLQSDAENVADWINDQLSISPELRQGRYEPDLTSQGVWE